MAPIGFRRRAREGMVSESVGIPGDERGTHPGPSLNPTGAAQRFCCLRNIEWRQQFGEIHRLFTEHTISTGQVVLAIFSDNKENTS